MDVEGKVTNGNSLTLNLEHKATQNDDYGLASAHTIDRDSWQQVGLMLVTSFNCGWILSFSNLVMVPLGWTWGVICLFVVGLYTAYGNWLLAAFHFIDGRRFIRYRDLMGYVYGKNMYHITWIFQFLTLLLGNMGFILLGGKALKGINSEFSDSPLRLQYYIVITGAAYFMFSFFIPTISAMKNWLGASAVVTITYIVLLLIVLVKDGKSNSNKDFDISGSEVSKVFNAFGAISAIIVSNTGGLLLEIQMFVAPIHEALDTKFLELGKAMHSGENLKRLFLLRALFFSGNTLVTAAFPFMGDFVNLLGSFSLVPLTFTFPSMVFIKVKGKTARTEKMAWHWFNIVFSSLLTIATTISAVRLIIENIRKYHFFADA
ncbi:Amino acid transporter, transmembrane domain [Sesbania bispinosa]|nr:Amino acid transporter, transmembrane domain [Sesbania bispinosa]